MNPGQLLASFKYPPYPILSNGERRRARLAFLQLSLASPIGSPPSQIHPGRSMVRDVPLYNHACIRNHTKCHTTSNRTYNCIKSDACKVFTIRLCSDPVISKEHHSFLAIRVNDINQLFRECTNFNLLEFNKVTEFFARYAEHTVVISLIYDKFRTEFISCPFLKLL